MMRHGWSMGVAMVLAAGCVERLPPPAAPDRVLSTQLSRAAADAEPGPGSGVVVLDAVGASARVEDLGTELDGAYAREICTTPCVAELSLGEHRLVFHADGRDDEVTVNVTDAPRAHRRALSFDSGAHDEFTGVAVTGLTLGVLLLPVLDPISSIDGQLGAGDAALIAAGVGVGALLVTGIVGVVLALTHPRQLRDGVSLEWDLDLR